MSLRRAIKIKNRQLKRLRMKLNVLVEKDGAQVDENIQRDLEKVVDVHFCRNRYVVLTKNNAGMCNNNHLQVAASKTHRNGGHWHPFFVR